MQKITLEYKETNKPVSKYSLKTKEKDLRLLMNAMGVLMQIEDGKKVEEIYKFILERV